MLPIALTLLVAVSAQAPVTDQASTADLGEVYALFLESRVRESQGNVDDAVASLERAIALAPTVPALHAQLASLLWRGERAREAAAAAEQALTLDGRNADANRVLGLYQAGLAAQDQGASGDDLADQAIGHLERSLDRQSPEPGSLLTLGQLYMRRDRYDEAAGVLAALVRDQPGYLEGPLLLSNAYQAAGRFDEAAAVLEELLAARPEFVRGHVTAASFYESANRWADAARHWALAADRRPSAAYRLNEGLAWLNGGSLQPARTALQQAVEAEPGEIAAWYLLAVVEGRLGNADAAESAAARIAAIDPDDARGLLARTQALSARQDYQGIVDLLAPRVQAPEPSDLRNGMFTRLVNELVTAYEAAGNSSAAIAVLERARQRDENLVFALAAAYERHDRIDEAEQTFRDLIADEPDHAGALNYLGYMLAERGVKLDEAVSLVQRALAIDANNPAYLDSLGWAYFKLGNYTEARDPLERAAAALPNVSVIQDHLGDLYVRTGQYGAAVEAFDRALSGDRDDVDVAVITSKRDEARRLAQP